MVVAARDRSEHPTYAGNARWLCLADWLLEVMAEEFAMLLNSNT